MGVADDRSEKPPARVGIVLGEKRDLVLEADTPLDARLEDELVNRLRSRGYRAEHVRSAGPAVDVSLVVRVVRFAADIRVLNKLRFDGRAVLVARATTTRDPRRVWTDVIDTRAEADSGALAGGSDGWRKVVEEFFEKTVAELAGRVSAGLPPPEPGS